MRVCGCVYANTCVSVYMCLRGCVLVSVFISDIYVNVCTDMYVIIQMCDSDGKRRCSCTNKVHVCMQVYPNGRSTCVLT